MTRIAAALIISAIAVSGIAHAEDFLTAAITIRVKAGPNQAAGLNRPEGEAIITLVPDDSQQNLAKVTLKPNSPDSLYMDAGTTKGSCPGTFGSWKFKIAAPEPNTDVTCVFDGQLLGCTGGGGGTPPTFQAAIVHLDLDVDSDNTSEPITEQKKPADQAPYHTLKQNPLANAQDKLEDPQGADDKTNPGLLLVVNHGFEQIKYAVADPKEDWQRPDKTPLKADDPDLAKGRIQITGRRDGQLKVTYPEAKLRIYRTDRGSPEYLAPGTETAAKQDTDIPILLEGIDPGGSDGSCRITVEFTPDGASTSGDGKTKSKATDVVKVTVVDITLQVDRNRDGTPSGTGTDVTDKDHPFTFWYNNDSDNEASDEQPGTPDYSRDSIANLRDMEDFQRMRLVVRGIDTLIQGGQVGVGLRWMPGTTHSPVVKAFLNNDVAGSTNYVDDAGYAALTKEGKKLGEVKGQVVAAIAKTDLKVDGGALVGSMLWECNGEGTRPADPEGSSPPVAAEGRLAAVLVKGGTSTVIGVNPHLHLKLADMRAFYEHWTAGDSYTTGSSFPAPTVARTADSTIDLATTEAVGLWDPNLKKLKGTNSTVVFVHGYRMKTWERRAYAETMYKRMYWQQFNGKFVLLSWPTEYWRFTTYAGIVHRQNYDRSEFTARRAGFAFADTLKTLKKRLTSNDTDKFVVTAHSMGNVVVSEALRRGLDKPVDAYLAFQSAEAADAYLPVNSPYVLSGIFGVLNKGPFAPNLYSHDAPRQTTGAQPGRSLVSWEEWESRDIVRGPKGGIVHVGPRKLNREEVLVTGPDGGPLYRALANAATNRVTYFNGADPATSGAWAANQYVKVDSNFDYSAVLLSKRREPRPRYIDEYAANDYLDYLPWSAIQSPSPPQEANGVLLRWASLATSDAEQVPHAAILAFISAPVSTAVGATEGTTMTKAGANAAPFTEAFDAEGLCGFGNNEDHDHSGEFEYHLSRLKGPRQFWIDVLSKVQ